MRQQQLAAGCNPPPASEVACLVGVLTEINAVGSVVVLQTRRKQAGTSASCCGGAPQQGVVAGCGGRVLRWRAGAQLIGRRRTQQQAGSDGVSSRRLFFSFIIFTAGGRQPGDA